MQRSGFRQSVTSIAAAFWAAWAQQWEQHQFAAAWAPAAESMPDINQYLQAL